MLVDATGSSTQQVVATLTSVIKQTVMPPKIRVIADPRTDIDLDTAKDIIHSRDGSNIEMSFQMAPDGEPNEITLLRNIKAFKRIYGVHKQSKRTKLFLVSHVMVLRAGHKLMANNVMERLMQTWEHGEFYYDLMFFKMRHGVCPPNLSSFIVYLPVVRVLCGTGLFQPILNKQVLFETHKHVKKDSYVDYSPTRTCCFGIVDS
jgi:hypothetical protein